MTTKTRARYTWRATGDHYTVGYYRNDETVTWVPRSEHPTPQEAARVARELNPRRKK